MSIIDATLITFFKRFPHRPIVVAYSGGIDSQVLLHALAKIKQQQVINNLILVCHVNHGLSVNAIDWQNSAKAYCKALALPLTICEVNVKEVTGESLESLARDARYKKLKETSPKDALIVTGHHSDDQSETFLLALKRGAGLKGLSAMAEVMPFTVAKNTSNKLDEQLLARPLLSVARAEVNHYAKTHQLTWIEDESNEDLRFDRNFIRHKIMPVLTARWPSILSTIKRSTQHCQEAQTLLTELAEEDLRQCKQDDFSLSIPALQTLSQARFNNLLRYFLATHQCLMPSKSTLNQVLTQIDAATDKMPEIKIGEYWLRRYQKSLHLTPEFKDVSTWHHELLTLPELGSSQQLNLPDNIGVLTLVQRKNDNDIKLKSCQRNGELLLRKPEQHEVVSIKFTHNNPKCSPCYREHSRELKKVLQELNIAPWQRKRIAFVYYGEHLAAAINLFSCKQYVAIKGGLSLSLSLSTNNND